MSKGRGNSPTAITPLGGSGGYGGSHSSAPSLNFPTSSGLFNITTTPLTMVHTIANSSELLGIPLPDDEPRTKTQRSTKVYIGKIPSGISDYFMEQLFLRCGPINTWTRCLDSSGKAMSYGFIEFQTVEGMLRCLRLLNGMQLLGNRLVVRVDFQTEFFIKEWSDLKRAEWERKKMDNIMSLDRTVLTFEEFLTSEDKNTEYAIQLLIHNLEQTHEEDPIQKEEDCEHPREKEREKRLRARNRDVDKQYAEKEREWLLREESQEAERAREREREDERQREKMRLVHRDLDYDTEDENNRRKKKSKKWLRAREERKRQREREKEEDALNARKEFEELHPGVATLDEKLLQAKELERQNDLGGEYALQDTSVALQIDVKAVDESKTQTANKYFSMEGEEEEDSLYHRKHKALALAPEEATPVPALTAAEPSISEEEFKRQVDRLKGLLESIPQRKAELYQFPLDWNLLVQNRVLDKKLSPFVSKLCFEYLGEVERNLIQRIVRRIANHEDPAKIQEYLGQAMDKEAEVRTT